jgi:hypothetical protein
VLAFRPRNQAGPVVVAWLVAAASALYPQASTADEGGVSYWLPGQFGSLAAVPAIPGWSFASIYYHTSISAGGNVAAARQATIGRFNPTVVVNLNAQLKAHADLAFVNANYVFQTPVLGGQFAFGVTGAGGRSSASINGTLTASAGPLTTTRFGSIEDSRLGFADLYPLASLRWNYGVHNFQTYAMGDIPVGTYDSDRLANFGIGHGAADAGVGYTYFDPSTGHEFSVVTGASYNFENSHTNYRNGIDWHLDWGASQFLTKQFQVGAVGYVFYQVTADKGAPLILSDNKSNVIGVGPQLGYLFPVGSMQGYLNVKAYYEFNAHDRAKGWSTWLTFAISPAMPEAPPTTLPVHK